MLARSLVRLASGGIHVAFAFRSFCGVKLVSPVIEIPQHVLLVLLAALNASAPDGSTSAPDVERPAVRQLAMTLSANPYQFAAEPFFDAIAGLRKDARFASFARRIFKTTSGQAYVPVQREARTILALRADVVIARHAAEQYARANAVALEAALGRTATLADLYLAHRVGLRLAIEIMKFEKNTPDALAALKLPDLDDTAPELVFDGDRALSISQIVAAVSRAAMRARRMASGPPPLPARRPRAPGRAVSTAMRHAEGAGGARQVASGTAGTWGTQIIVRQRALASAQ